MRVSILTFLLFLSYQVNAGDKAYKYFSTAINLSEEIYGGCGNLADDLHYAKFNLNAYDEESPSYQSIAKSLLKLSKKLVKLNTKLTAILVSEGEKYIDPCNQLTQLMEQSNEKIMVGLLTIDVAYESEDGFEKQIKLAKNHFRNAAEQLREYNSSLAELESNYNY